MPTPTKDIFCSICNETKPFTLGVVAQGEFTATCTVCNHILHFPAGADLRELIVEHNTENTPRILVDESGEIVITPEQQAAIDAALAP